MHNGCMILFVGAEDAARLAGGGDEEFAEVVPDKGMASAIDQANTLDLDDFVEVTARVTPGAAELVAGLGGAGAPATHTDGQPRSIAPRADFRGFSPAAGADQPGRLPPLRRRVGRDRRAARLRHRFPCRG